MSSADSGSYDYLFKVVLIGDSSVGKTSLLTRFADDAFSESFIATIGVDFRVRTIEVDGKFIKLQIWDTAGQERFRTITSAYYRGADGIAIVYDITNKESFEHVHSWMEEIQRYSQGAGPGESLSRMVIGNKCDLEAKRSVRQDEAEDLGKQLSIPVVETSAKSNTNVDKAFSTMVTQIIERRAKDSAFIKEVQSSSANLIMPDAGATLFGIPVPSFCGCLPCVDNGPSTKQLTAFSNLDGPKS